MLGVKTLPLDVLSPDESVALLHEHRPNLPEDDSDLNAIVRELGGLPLALHLAGSYLWRTRFDVEPKDYLVRLRSPDLLQHPSLWEAKGISPTSHVQSVARTFMISYKRLDAADPTDRLAVALLARVAHFAPGEPIPRDLLRATLNLPGDDPDAPQAGEALNRLAELGLIETDEEGALRMHRLVALFVRSEMARSESKATGEEAQVAVEEALANRLRSLVAKRRPAPLLAWIPHLRVVCDAARGREDKRAAELCNTLGYCLRMVGASSEARPLYERALTIREKVLGGEHPDTAITLNSLAAVLTEQGDYEEAQPLYEQALAIREKVLGKEHPDTEMLRENLRSLYSSQRF
jgi:tetratricopeptide (TPR) repeat protein